MGARHFVRVVVVASMVLAVAVAVSAQQGDTQEFDFRGEIEEIDTRARTLTVNGEAVEGWMAAMSMDYRVDEPEVLEAVEIGDQITAKVYEGNFTTLFDVRVVEPEEEDDQQ